MYVNIYIYVYIYIFIYFLDYMYYYVVVFIWGAFKVRCFRGSLVCQSDGWNRVLHGRSASGAQ